MKLIDLMRARAARILAFIVTCRVDISSVIKASALIVSVTILLQIEVKYTYTDSESSVVCCDGLVISPEVYLIASAAGDSHVRIYQTDKGLSLSPDLCIYR